MKDSLNNLIRAGVLDSKDTQQLNKNSFANLFSVVNRGAKSYFNLCKGISFSNVDSVDPGMFAEYTVTENDSWTSISYRFYGTVELWWLVCKFNRRQGPVY